MAYRFSKFVFSFNGTDWGALYHSVSIKVLCGGPGLSEAFEDLRGRSFSREEIQARIGTDSKIFSFLVKNNFLVRPETDDAALIKKIGDSWYLSNPTISLMYLLVTDNCNLSCKYCSVESVKPQDFAFCEMTEEIADRALEVFSKTLSKHAEPKIIFYGGEPLLNWPVVCRAITKARQMQRIGHIKARKKLSISMVTNGTLVTNEIADFLAKNKVGVGVSIDGPSSMHDKMRVTRGGGRSWKQAIRGFKLLKKYEVKPSFSCTIGRHNLKQLPLVARALARFEPSGVGFNLIKALPVSKGVETPPEETNLQLLKASKYLYSKGIVEDRYRRKLDCFVKEKKWFYDCAGYGRQIAVGADGRVGPCHILVQGNQEVLGSVFDKDITTKILESALMKKWASRTPFKMTECFDCVGLGICGGGCAAESIAKKGDFWAMDEAFCVHCKTILGSLIGDLAVKLNAETIAKKKERRTSK